MKLTSKIVPILLFSMMLLIIIPVPPIILDILLICNIALAAVIFLMSIYSKNVLEFSGLPIILIVTTLIRIVLNVTSSRLILGEGTGGKLIEAIGSFTIQGNLVVGIIIFIIITLVMFLVINKGTERIAEVSARFELDGMPVKQMAIDAELSNGFIDINTANEKRKNLLKGIDFFKSMDGATKFVKGDSVASLVITVVNIIGGLITGVTMHGLSFAEAGQKYTILTVGDGLVNQIPALLVAVATAITISKSSDKADDMMQELISQVLNYNQPLKISGIVFFILGLLGLTNIIPGIPWFICALIGGALFLASTIESETPVVEEDDALVIQEEEPVIQNNNYLYVNKIVLEVGTNVAKTISSYDDVAARYVMSEDFKARIERMRDKIKSVYGIKIPEIKITDSYNIPANAFSVKIPNVPVKALSIRPGSLLAVFSDASTVIDFGEEANIPELDLKGFWVKQDDAMEAESYGAINFDTFNLILDFMEKVIIFNLDKLITREVVKEFKEEVATYNSAVIEEINQKHIENAVIQKVIQNLLTEKISIKNFEFILECIADCHLNGQGVKLDVLMQHLRLNLATTIVEDKIVNNTLSVVMIGREKSTFLNQVLRGEVSQSSSEVEKTLSNICLEILSEHKANTQLGRPFVFVSENSIRQYVFDILMRGFGEKINIISMEEIPMGIQIDCIKEI